MLSDLPADPSNSEFLDIRQRHLLYIDKTSQIATFLTNSIKAQLFTRPRRFGKSLMLSTIAAMYSGHRELFGGSFGPELAVYPEGMWHWRTHPVLYLDMLGIQDQGAGIESALADLVYQSALDMGLQDQLYFRRDNPIISLTSLIKAMNRQGQARVVILVDEYDAPILEHMHHPRAALIRQQLAGFYSVFKSTARHVEKLVMTGVTRFVKTGFWSKLNHVVDQSETTVLHDLVGFTDTELDVLWAQIADGMPEIRSVEGTIPLSREAWKEWYNGYRFTATAMEPIYNPFAIVCSLKEGTIKDYWSQSGHLGIVEKMLQEPWTGMEPQDRVPLYLTRPDVASTYELHFDWLDRLEPGRTPEEVLLQWEPAQIVPLLYQTGYLTLTEGQKLTPPNREIANYLSKILLKPWLGSDGSHRFLVYRGHMLAALRSLNIPGFVESLQSVLHLFPHQRFPRGFHQACNLVLDLTVLGALGRIAHSMERSGAQGDADTAFVWDAVSLVIEFKTGQSQSARSGQKQIQDRACLRSLPKATRLYLGLSLYTEGAQVVSWSCQGYSAQGERLGQPLTDQDPWPTARVEIDQRWGG